MSGEPMSGQRRAEIEAMAVPSVVFRRPRSACDAIVELLAEIDRRNDVPQPHQPDEAAAKRAAHIAWVRRDFAGEVVGAAIDDLLAEVQELTAENDRLRSEVEFLADRPSQKAGAGVSDLARVAYQAYCEALRRHPDVSLHLNLMRWEDLPEPDRRCFEAAVTAVREAIK